MAPQHQKELAQLRRSRGRRVRKIIYGALLLIIFFVLASFLSSSSDEQGIEAARKSLISNGTAWGSDLVAKQHKYNLWLSAHGLSIEVRAFEKISSGILHTATYSRSVEGTAILGSLYIGLHFGLLRIAFLIIACWRLWAFVLLASVASVAWAKRLHTGRDLLGETGNGRPFYSGIRAGLDVVNANRAPEKQVTGLACPVFAPEEQVKASALGKVLEEFGVATSINLKLAAVVEHRKDWPAYVAPGDEEGLLHKYYEGSQLGENTALILRKALELHHQYREGFIDQTPEPPAAGMGKVDQHEYSQKLKGAFHRVLTPEMRVVIGEVPAEEVATIVIAYEAGKTMAHAYEGSKWLRRSSYSELCSRAILHALPEYGDTYNFDTRTDLRRAIIYGSRSSSFGPVRFPTSLSVKARALRQWVELLMACPHQLETVADEVEMFGVICRIHSEWLESFLNGVMAMRPEFVENVYVNSSNLVLMPLKQLVATLLEVTGDVELKRLEQLVASVHQSQKLASMSIDASAEGATPVAFSYEKVFAPFSTQEIQDLTALHGVSVEELKAWSTLRAVLNGFSWLGRRVGDYSVPDSSVIFAVMKLPHGISGGNELGLVGKPGMVALRGTRLEERWGKSWRNRFNEIDSATMAENQVDFERAMAGIKDRADEELEKELSAGIV